MELTPNGLHCTIAELANACNLTQKTIRDAVAAGCPTIKQGKVGKGNPTIVNLYDYLQFREGRLRGHARGGDDGGIRSQLDAIKIEKAQFDLSERRGDLFHFSDWMPLIEEKMIAARNRYAAIADEIRAEFADVPRIAQIARAVHLKIIAATNRQETELEVLPDEIEERR